MQFVATAAETVATNAGTGMVREEDCMQRALAIMMGGKLERRYFVI